MAVIIKWQSVPVVMKQNEELWWLPEEKRHTLNDCPWTRSPESNFNIHYKSQPVTFMANEVPARNTHSTKCYLISFNINKRHDGKEVRW